MATLTVANNNASNPQSINVWPWVIANDESVDPYDPAFTDRVISHSLLREGGVLALEDRKAKELVFPLIMGPFADASTMAKQIALLNQIISSPGATWSWQDDGMSQATVFDGLTGQFDIQYSYRRAQKFYTNGKLRLFAQPFGHTGSVRPYAAASSVGPLLLISPYASGGGTILTASTTGFGASPQIGPLGASSGISYWGNPSIAGDAPALLQISYVGPFAAGATGAGLVPDTIVSLLPDSNYRPFVNAIEIASTTTAGNNGASFWTSWHSSTVVASTFLRLGGSAAGLLAFKPLPIANSVPTLDWAGQQRLFAIARATQVPGILQTQGNALVDRPTTATVLAGDWGLYDLGTFTLRPSQAPAVPVLVEGTAGAGASGSGLDVNGLVMLPDNTSWFLNGEAIGPSQYGLTPGQAFIAIAGGIASAPWSNTLILDDVMGDQLMWAGALQSFAPSPLGAVASSARITQYSRGLVPRPDPKRGLPILAILGVGQFSTPTSPVQVNNIGSLQFISGATWTNPQNFRTMAQVNVLERTRYILP